MLNNGEFPENQSVEKVETVSLGSRSVDLGTYQPVTSVPKRGYDTFKRIFDFLYASIAIALLAPVLAIIAIAIKIESPGPAVYKQMRIGKNGKEFGVYKFRTMFLSVENEKINKYFLKLVTHPNMPKVWSTKVDPRVTPVGRLLRKFSLDEMPQIANVLKGEMSFVGPRALLPYEFEYIPEEMKRRVDVLPGITGFRQVEASNWPSYKDLLVKDVEYVNRRSFYLDLKIILRTIVVSLNSKLED